MRSADLFAEDDWSAELRLDESLIEDLRKGHASGYDDLAACGALAELAHDQLQDFGTGGGETLNDQQLAQVVRALEAVAKRLGVEFKMPFDNFRRFKSYWLKHDAYGSWQARRDILDAIFDPLTARLARIEEDAYENLAVPVSPRAATGWSDVDEEIRELRRRFASCTSPQDYRSVGTYCMGVVDSVSRVSYDPAKHVKPGEAALPPDKTKLRLERVVETALPGRPNEELRSLAKASVTAAHRVKHAGAPSRMEAGIAADAVILMANILKRLDLGEPEPD